MDDVEQIKSKVDIVDVVEEYVTLTPAGSNYKALSPFRQERTPSFMVNPGLQIFKDFGSDQGGDVFTFVMEMEGVEFREALSMLAERAGVTLSRQNGRQSQAETGGVSKEQMRGALAYARRFFEKVLEHETHGKDARAYLEERGVNDEARQAFGIGFAPYSFQALRSALAQKQIPQQAMVQSGLEIEKAETGRVYDRFRGRLMFPIQDVMGRVVGFSGRILPQYDDDTMGKYINTPQTLIYDKSTVLYGLYQAKQAIKQKGEAILVEGNLDVVLSHQYGIQNVVAVSGTALTHQHLRILKRFTKKLVFCFDNDAAGISAAKRSVQMAYQHAFVVKAISLEDKDPADLITEHAAQWEQRINEQVDFMEYYIGTLRSRGTTAEEIMTYEQSQQEIAELLSAVENPLQKDRYVKEVAELLEVNEHSIYALLERYGSQTSSETQGPSPQENQRAPKSLGQRLQEQLVGYAFLGVGVYDISKVESFCFTDPTLRAILEYIKEAEEISTLTLDALQKTSPEAEPRAREAVFEVERGREESQPSHEDEEQAVKEMIAHLKRTQKQSALKELRSRLKKARATNNQEEIDSLMQRINQLLQYN
jgi:DNA primase